jgi:hypothetical protein
MRDRTPNALAILDRLGWTPDELRGVLDRIEQEIGQALPAAWTRAALADAARTFGDRADGRALLAPFLRARAARVRSGSGGPPQPRSAAEPGQPAGREDAARSAQDGPAPDAATRGDGAARSRAPGAGDADPPNPAPELRPAGALGATVAEHLARALARAGSERAADPSVRAAAWRLATVRTLYHGGSDFERAHQERALVAFERALGIGKRTPAPADLDPFDDDSPL